MVWPVAGTPWQPRSPRGEPMNTATKCLVVLAMLASLRSHAAEPGDVPVAAGSKNLAIKLHPLPIVTFALAGGVLIPVELEWALDPHFSLSGMPSPVIALSSIGVALNGSFRVYLTGHAPDGLFLEAQAGTILFHGGASFDLQPYVGYQVVFQNGLTVGAAAGISLDAWAKGSNFPLAVQVPIGFAF